MWTPRRSPAEIARAWHWNPNAPVDVINVRDPDVPADLVACGAFARLQVACLRENGWRDVTCEDPSCFLAFDPDSRWGRLYLVLSPAVRRATRRLPRDGAPVWLDALAASVGGRQQGGYPRVRVFPIGVVAEVEYYARKYGHGQGADNGATFYHVHDRHPRPWLAVDDEGRLWYVGGDYDGSDVRGIVG